MKSALRALILVLLALLAGSAEAQQRQTGPYLTVSPTPSKLSGMGAGFVQQDANGIAFVAQGAPGSGTVTNTAGALALGSMVVGNGGADLKTVGGTIGGAFTTAGPVTFSNGSIGVTLQFPANGPFNYVFPPASQTLASLAGSETFTNKIYSGGQLSGTFSGNPAFSGVPSFTGLSPGVQTRCLGLDVGNNLVTLNAGCGSGGGGSAWTLTDGTHTVASVAQVTVTGGTVGGSTPNATLTIAAGGTVTQNGNLATNQIVTGGTNGTTDIKTNTTGLNVLTALSTNVGSAGAFAKNNGDALSGTYTGAPTFSGNVVLSGVPKFTGLAGGTAVACLALDGVNSAIAITCTGGGSGTVNTGGANQLAYYASLGNAVSGFGPLTNGQVPCGSTGSAPVPCVPTAGTPNLVVSTSAGGLSISSTSLINDISSSGTAIVTGDNTKLDKLGAFTYTLAQAGTTGFGTGWGACLINVGAGNATINATTSTFVGAGGSTTLVLTPGAWACPTSDGTNYQTPEGNNIIAGAGITVTKNSNGTTTVAASGSGGVAATPQGRLTLVTGVPVMVSDQTAKTTVYYDTFQGNLYPNWNGSVMVNVTITSDEISMGLDAGVPHVASGSLYDVFGTASAAICVGPAWSSTSSRGTGAGTTELQLKSGVWTNKNSLTNCWGGASGTTNLGAIAANQGTYLGTIYGTAAGQTGVQFTAAAAAGGSNAFVGLFNAYNRVAIASRSQDSNASYDYTTAAWRAADASNSNRISYVDGLALISATGTYQQNVKTTTVDCAFGLNLNATTGAPPIFRDVQSAATTATLPLSTEAMFPPSLGLNFLQGMEFGGTTCSFENAANGTILARVSM